MKKEFFHSLLLSVLVMMLLVSCQKEDCNSFKKQHVVTNTALSTKQTNFANPPFDLNVILRGACNSTLSEADDEEETGDCPVGHLKFRQDPDAAKIVVLDTKLHNMLPNHAYALQRAVDEINVVDGNCTSTIWRTLGKGLTPQLLMTDAEGNGSELFWRDLTAVPTGSRFDIHFRVIDAISKAVVLSSDCFQYQVR